MIKKFLLTQTLFLIMVFTTQAQNNEDLTNYIESQKEEIEAIVNLSTMRLEIQPIEVEGFNPNDKYNFHSRDLSVFDDEDSLRKFIEDFTELRVELLYPYNLVEFHFDDYEYAEYLGEKKFSYFYEHPEELPFYEPLEIRFKDGKTEKTKKYLNERDFMESFNEDIPEPGPKFSDLENYFLDDPMISAADRVGFYTSKPIESIAFNVTINAPEFTTYRLSQNGEVVETPDGKIELIGISGDEYTLRFPATLEDRYTILPLYKDGRVLKEQSSSLSFGYGEKSIPKLLKIIGLYDQALLEVKSGNLNSTDEIDAFMEALVIEEKLTITEEEQVAEKRQKLRGPISEVLVKIKNEKLNKHTFTFEMAVDSDEESQSSKEELMVVSDFKTKKYGLLDINGNWIVKPEYNYLFTIVSSQFYYESPGDKDYIYYFFDSKNKQLNRVDFLPTNKKPIAGRYIIIEKEKNGFQGVFDLKTQKTIIPITEYIINDLLDNGNWSVSKLKDGHFSSGVLDGNGAIIIPPIQDEIKYHDGFFYVESYLSKEEYPDVYPSTQLDIYNSEGINITQGKFNTIEGGFVDGIQFVENLHYKKSGKNAFTRTGKDFYLIDTNGKVLAEFPKDEYKTYHPFENGLARIQNAAGLYGFIDVEGKLALPFEYVFATDFKAKYALAEFIQDGQTITAFIDKTGKVIKILPASFKDMDYQGDTPYVILKNSNVYDFEGNSF